MDNPQMPQPTPSQPMQQQPVQPKKSNTAMIVLIVVLVIFALFATAAFFLFRAVKNGIQDISETTNLQITDEGVTINTDNGSSQSGGAVVPAEFPSDAPIYEPSTPILVNTIDQEPISQISVVLETDDSVDMVEDFYVAELKKAGWKTTVHSSGADGVVLVGSKDNNKRTIGVTIAPQEGKTVFTIAASKE